MKTFRDHAFTLIELLIVVAIIAILAAIAVPNFLEAQTRSKVSRCKSDMRTLALAVHSYVVDNNHAPPSGLQVPGEAMNFLSIDVNGNGSGMGHYLTTPIAYITSIPNDIFSLAAVNGQSHNLKYFAFAYGNYGDPFASGLRGDYYIDQHTSQTPDFYRLPHIKLNWLIESAGPDFRWWNQNMGGIYDPTNGTVSNGDIWYIDSLGLLPK